ncbi:hypothetical protein ACIPMW_00130 [Streptomyces sp. NPDC086669]|uniref:hypothetical protein n=1 Tax=Streptomyces sp. NPDC086669 TaxID=3365753 RepID=UPI003820E236
MDERREPPPEATDRAPIPTGIARLSPVQEAWSAYVNHSLHQCPTCRRVDGSPCEKAERLYGVYTRLANEGMDRLRQS